MNTVIECEKCYMVFDNVSRKPLILPCNHVLYCKACIQRDRIVTCNCGNVFSGDIESLKVSSETLAQVERAANSNSRTGTVVQPTTRPTFKLQDYGGRIIIVDHFTFETKVSEVERVFIEKCGYKSGTFGLLAMGKFLESNSTLGQAFPIRTSSALVIQSITRLPGGLK